MQNIKKVALGAHCWGLEFSGLQLSHVPALFSLSHHQNHSNERKSTTPTPASTETHQIRLRNISVERR